MGRERLLLVPFSQVGIKEFGDWGIGSIVENGADEEISVLDESTFNTLMDVFPLKVQPFAISVLS